ncbi:integrase core domain-containing protein, partial [Pseudomonas neuropathica]
DLDDAQRAFDIWREIYNQKRPHQALGMQVPATRYSSSPREYQEQPAAPEYDDGDVVRKVQVKGEILNTPSERRFTGGQWLSEKRRRTASTMSTGVDTVSPEST